MSGCCTVEHITQIEKHANADRLNVATVLGEKVIVGLNMQVGDRVVYFSCDLQLSEEFCEKNNLITKFDKTGKKIGGGYFSENRRVRAQSFRGIKSNGYVCPLEYFAYCGADVFLEIVPLGFSFSELNGYEICKKYETLATIKQRTLNKIKVVKKKRCPLFLEHVDTQHLRHHWGDKVYPDNKIIITEKIHSTSGRYGLLPDEQPYKIKFFNWFYKKVCKLKYQYFIGSRRVIIGTRDKKFVNKGFYANESFRFKSVERIDLLPGETLYFELGYINQNNQALMPSVSKEKAPKELKNKYVFPMVFKYGLQKGETKIWVYRITHLKEGKPYDLSWNDVKIRCKELQIDTVPFIKEIVVCFETNLEDILLVDEMNELVNGPSRLDQSHIQEGVVIRIEKEDSINFLKCKSFHFNVCEGIMKEQDYVDIEEAS